MSSTGSLRNRLLVIAALSIAVTLAIAGAGLVWLFEHQLLRRVAHDLDIRASELARAFEVNTDGEPMLNRDLADPRYDVPYSGAYWQVNEKGERILASRSVWDFPLNSAGVPLSERRAGAFELEGPEKAELYVVEREVRIESSRQPRVFSLLVALDHAEVVLLREAFARDVWKVMALIAALMIAGAWLQLRFGLSPLAGLRASLAAVREGKQRRLDGPFPTEITPLTGELNTLLDRQDDLVRRARDRAGAIAHRLKTPLTILLGDVDRLARNGHVELAEAMREQCSAIRAYVERELARSRTHGALDTASARTHVLPIVERLVDLMRRMDVDSRIRWSVDIPADVTASMEADDFAEIVGNLVDNARKWAATRVSIALAKQDDGLVLTVTDDGPGIRGPDPHLVLERGVHFGRDDDGSTGLGLTIVTDTLAEYGRKLAVASTSKGCAFSFVVS